MRDQTVTVRNASEKTEDYRTQKIKSMMRGRIFDGVWTYALLIVLLVIWLIPIVWVVATSFRGGANNGLVTDSFFPAEWSFQNYAKLFQVTRNIKYATWVWNTFKIAVLNTVGTTFITLCTAYALSRFRFKMRKPFMNIALILGMFPGFMAMSAIFILLGMIKDASGNTILLNNTWSLLMIYMSGAGLGFFVSKGYLDTLPVSLDEAAYVDGASKFTIYFKVILPLAKSIIIYTALMAFMAPWTDYVLARVILGGDKTMESWTVAVGLYELTDSTKIADFFTTFAAGCVIIAIPIVALYLSLQKFMVEGISAGAVKG